MVPGLPSPLVSPPGIDALAIRHGESEWNASGRWQGQADPPLTDRGRRQAVAAGQLLARELRFDAITASDLRRAAETATIIGQVIGTPVTRLDPRLQENHAGEWEGLTRDEIHRDWPGVLDVDGRPPGFETYESTVARMRAALVDTAGALAPGSRLLVVGHSGAIRSLRRAVGGDDVRIANLGGFWFHVDGESITPGASVALLQQQTTNLE